MQRKTIKSRRKVSHYIDIEVDLRYLHESIPAFIGEGDERMHNYAYDAVNGIEIDAIQVDEKSNQAAILFHIIETGEKFYCADEWSYEGKDMNFYTGHDVHYGTHNDHPEEELLNNGYHSEILIEGVMTDHFGSVIEEISDDDPTATDWERKIGKRYRHIEVHEVAHLNDLHWFMGLVFKALTLDC